MKRTVKSLKEAQTPLLRKIQSIESQLQPIENQMKEKVWRTSSIHQSVQLSVTYRNCTVIIKSQLFSQFKNIHDV